MSPYHKLALASVSFLAFAAPAYAETAQADAAQSGVSGDADIVVTARRRDEGKQDVPLAVQAVTAQDLQKLAVREFKDIQTLVPGLTMAADANGIGNSTQLRGIKYDVVAAGNNGTVEFYLNDAPISAGILFQSMFDIGQIEVLRGPQGTLRGRASPSGSITITTHKPDLSQIGASISGTVNTFGNVNGQAAINLPRIADKLALRIAGVYDENDDNRVHSLNNAGHPSRITKGGRISLRAEPIEGLSLFASYTSTLRDASTFDAIESGNFADPSLPASPIAINPNDRVSLLSFPRTYTQRFQVYNWQAEYRLLGQNLNYVGSHNSQVYDAVQPNDPSDIAATAPTAYRQASQVTHTTAKQTNHEVRLSSDERIAGMFDYVVGYMNNKLSNPTHLVVETRCSTVRSRFRGS